MSNQKVSLGTLYEMNKQIMKNRKQLSEKELNAIKKDLEQWFNWHLDGYAMLLCRERYDFTVFHLYEQANPNPPAIAAKELIELAKERGQVLSIEKELDNNAWQIWIKIENKPYAYYLFNCDNMVIEC